MSGLSSIMIGIGAGGQEFDKLQQDKKDDAKTAFLGKLEQQKADDEENYHNQDIALRQESEKASHYQVRLNQVGGNYSQETYDPTTGKVVASAPAPTSAIDAANEAKQKQDDEHQKSLAEVMKDKGEAGNYQVESEGKSIANNIAKNYGVLGERAKIAKDVADANHANGDGRQTGSNKDKDFSDSDQAADALLTDRGLAPSIKELVGPDGIDPARARQIAKDSYEYAKANGKNARDVFLNNLQLEKKGSAPGEAPTIQDPAVLPKPAY